MSSAARPNDPRRNATAASATAAAFALLVLVLGLAIGTSSGDPFVALLGRASLAGSALATAVAACGLGVRLGRAPVRSARALAGLVAIGTLAVAVLVLTTELAGGSVPVRAVLAALVGSLGLVLGACAYGVVAAARSVRDAAPVRPVPGP